MEGEGRKGVTLWGMEGLEEILEEGGQGGVTLVVLVDHPRLVLQR